MTGKACAWCGEPAEPAVLVGVPVEGSGAGGPSTWGCLPCAHKHRDSPLAPAWIGEEIARAEAQQRAL